MDSDRMSRVPQRKIHTRSDIYFNTSVSNRRDTFARLSLSFYLCALFIISSPPSRNDFISVGMDKSPAQRSTTSPPSLVSTPTLCFPPSTNWISRMLCWNRDEMQVRGQKATRRRRQCNIDEWTGVFKSPVRALPTKLARTCDISRQEGQENTSYSHSVAPPSICLCSCQRFSTNVRHI